MIAQIPVDVVMWPVYMTSEAMSTGRRRRAAAPP
jgi:hypothetical protein